MFSTDIYSSPLFLAYGVSALNEWLFLFVLSESNLSALFQLAKIRKIFVSTSFLCPLLLTINIYLCSIVVRTAFYSCSAAFVF